MEAINAALRAIFGAILNPFAGTSPMLTLVPISIAVGVVALFLFKLTSNQAALAAARSQQNAGFFEIRLFNDDLRNILRGQARILKATGLYTLHILKPLALLMPPLFLVVAQLQFHYGYQGLRPGEATLVRVTLEPNAPIEGDKPSVELSAPEGVDVETPSVWIPSERTLVWRVRAKDPGEFQLNLDLGDERVTKSLTVSDRVVRRSPVRPAGLAGQLLYPAEPALPNDAPIESIEVGYPSANVNLAGWHVNWIVAFLLLSILAAFVLRKPLRVTI